LDRDHLTRLYDDEYAASYEEEFFRSSPTLTDSEHGLDLIKQLIACSSPRGEAFFVEPCAAAGVHINAAIGRPFRS
jgi:hypothetical protein